MVPNLETLTSMHSECVFCCPVGVFWAYGMETAGYVIEKLLELPTCLLALKVTDMWRMNPKLSL